MLGAYEVTVTEMAAAFAVFASGGVARTPTFIKKVESGAGDLPLPPQPPERRVMDPAVAYLTTSLLSSVISEGTGKRARSLERPLAGKTGTTNRAKDAWFIGYSTDLVVAVWVGYDDALPLGWGESGATTALPIWMNMMKAAHRGKPATEFPRPGDIVEAELDPGTGLRSRFGQEETVTELFLPGTVPEEIAPEQVDEEPDSSDDKEHQAQGPELETDDDSALRDPELPPEAPNDEDVSLPPPGEEPPPF
jgi:penicillin-binding protein 1A